MRAGLKRQKLVTQAEVRARLPAQIATGSRYPYHFVVLDEAQDVSVAKLRFVAAGGVRGSRRGEGRPRDARARDRRARAAYRRSLDVRTALKILAQESAALLAPGEVAARLDELVAGAEATGETVREIEELSRLGEASQRLRATLLQ